MQTCVHRAGRERAVGRLHGALESRVHPGSVAEHRGLPKLLIQAGAGDMSAMSVDTAMLALYAECADTVWAVHTCVRVHMSMYAACVGWTHTFERSCVHGYSHVCWCAEGVHALQTPHVRDPLPLVTGVPRRSQGACLKAEASSQSVFQGQTSTARGQAHLSCLCDCWVARTGGEPPACHPALGLPARRGGRWSS